MTKHFTLTLLVLWTKDIWVFLEAKHLNKLQNINVQDVLLCIYYVNSGNEAASYSCMNLRNRKTNYWCNKQYFVRANLENVIYRHEIEFVAMATETKQPGYSHTIRFLKEH